MKLKDLFNSEYTFTPYISEIAVGLNNPLQTLILCDLLSNYHNWFTIAAILNNKFGEAPGTSTIIASQGGNDDYLLAPAVERTFTINKQTQTITFGEIATKRYGDPAFNLPATTDKGLTISYQVINTNVTTVVGNTVTIHNSGTTDIIASQVGDDYRYAATPVSQTLTVQKTRIKVLIHSQKKFQRD